MNSAPTPKPKYHLNLAALLLKAQALLYTYANTQHPQIQPPREGEDGLLEEVSQGAARFFRRRMRRVSLSRALAREACERRCAARQGLDCWREHLWSDAIRCFWQQRAARLTWPSELVNFSEKFQAESLQNQKPFVARGKRARSPSSPPKRGRPKRRRKTGITETETGPEMEMLTTNLSPPAPMNVRASHLVFGQAKESEDATESPHRVAPALEAYCASFLRSVAGCQDTHTHTHTRGDGKGGDGEIEEGVSEKAAQSSDGDFGVKRRSGSMVPIVPIKRTFKEGMLTVLCGLPLQISQDEQAWRKDRGRLPMAQKRPELLPLLFNSRRVPRSNLSCLPLQRHVHSTSRLVSLTKQLDTTKITHNHIKAKYQCKLAAKDLSSMSVRYESGGGVYESSLHIAEPLESSDALCLASLSLLMATPFPEMTPAIRSLQNLSLMTQATEIKMSQKSLAQIEAEISDAPFPVSQTLSVSPLALQEFYAHVIVKSGNSSDWIKRIWSNPIVYDLDSATSSWIENDGGIDTPGSNGVCCSPVSLTSLLIPMEGLVFFARRSERERRRPRPSKPANAFVLEKALKADLPVKESKPPDELMSISRIPIWASIYRHADSWDILPVLLNLAPILGGPLFTPLEQPPNNMQNQRSFKTSLSSLLSRFQLCSSLPPVLFSRLVRHLPSNNSDQSSYDPNIYVSNAMSLPSLLTIKSSSRVVRKLEVCWHPCDEAVLWQAVMDQAPSPWSMVVDSGLVSETGCKSFKSALTEMKKQVELATVSSKATEKTRGPPDRKVTWLSSGINWSLVASCLNINHFPFDRFRSPKICHAKFISLWAEYTSTFFPVDDELKATGMPIGFIGLTPRPILTVKERLPEESPAVTFEDEWEHSLMYYVEFAEQGPLIQEEMPPMQACVWAQLDSTEIESLLPDLETGTEELDDSLLTDQTVIEASWTDGRADCGEWVASEGVAGDESAYVRGAGVFPPCERAEGGFCASERVSEFRREVEAVKDLSCETLSELIWRLAISEESNVKPEVLCEFGVSSPAASPDPVASIECVSAYVSSVLKSEELRSCVMSKVTAMSLLSTSCPIRRVIEVDMRLQEMETRAETEIPGDIMSSSSQLLSSDSSRLFSVAEYCKETLRELPGASFSVSASDKRALAKGMDLNTAIVQCSKLLEVLQVAGLMSPIAHTLLQHSRDWQFTKPPALPVLLDPDSHNKRLTHSQMFQIDIQTNRLKEVKAWLILAIHLNQLERVALHLHGTPKIKGLLKKKPPNLPQTLKLHENFVMDRSLRLHVQQSRQCVAVLQCVKAVLARKVSAIGEVSAATVYQQTLLQFDKLFLPPHASQNTLTEHARKEQANILTNIKIDSLPAAIMGDRSLGSICSSSLPIPTDVPDDLRGCLTALIVLEKCRRLPVSDGPLGYTLSRIPINEFKTLYDGLIGKLDISKSPFPAVTAVARPATIPTIGFGQSDLKNSPRKTAERQKGWVTEQWKQQATQMPQPQMTHPGPAAWYGSSPRPQTTLPSSKYPYANRVPTRAPTDTPMQAMPMAQPNGYAPMNPGPPQWLQMPPTQRPYQMPPQDPMGSADPTRPMIMRPNPAPDMYRQQPRMAYPTMARGPPQWNPAGRHMGGMDGGWGPYGGPPQFAYNPAPTPYGRPPMDAWGPPPMDSYAQQRYMAGMGQVPDAYGQAQQQAQQQLHPMDYHSGGGGGGDGVYMMDNRIDGGYKVPWPQKQ